MRASVIQRERKQKRAQMIKEVATVMVAVPLFWTFMVLYLA